MGIPRSSNKSISNLYFPPDGSSPKLVVSDGATAITLSWKAADPIHRNSLYSRRVRWVCLPRWFTTTTTTSLPASGSPIVCPAPQHSVVRGGYGLFFQRDIQDKWVESSVNPPFVRSANTVRSDQLPIIRLVQPDSRSLGGSAQIFANSSDFASGGVASLESDARTHREGNSGIGHLCRQQSPASGIHEYAEPGRSGSGSNQGSPTLAGLGHACISPAMTATPYHSGQFKVQKAVLEWLELLDGIHLEQSSRRLGGTFVGEADRGGGFQDAL